MFATSLVEVLTLRPNSATEQTETEPSADLAQTFSLGSRDGNDSDGSCCGCTGAFRSFVSDCAQEVATATTDAYHAVTKKVDRNREEAIARGQYRRLPVTRGGDGHRRDGGMVNERDQRDIELTEIVPRQKAYGDDEVDAPSRAGEVNVPGDEDSQSEDERGAKKDRPEDKRHP
ncbi:hypothetical protein QFC24_007053 [Naganishia onofrii]|uniref:Uncharacterized protein n=1 Tax=Naganishia onofrii TaxID=1851511 RepID=A0ACC2WTU1_9TREE|nr:hypothetical protein QFC24_007053 [Naganishia onofrii]